jgi:hypothetical protein
VRQEGNARRVGWLIVARCTDKGLDVVRQRGDGVISDLFPRGKRVLYVIRHKKDTVHKGNCGETERRRNDGQESNIEGAVCSSWPRFLKGWIGALVP